MSQTQCVCVFFFFLLNRYTKGRGLPGCESVCAVERSYKYSNSSAWCSASRSEWLDILQKGMLCCRESEKTANMRNDNGHLGQSPPPKHMPATLQWPCSCLLYTKHCTQNPCRSHGLQEEFGILDESAQLHWRGGPMSENKLGLLLVCCHCPEVTIKAQKWIPST